MNLFKQMYCNQYYELKSKGKEASARANGTHLLSIALVMYALSIYFLLISIIPDLRDSIEDMLQDTFGYRSGRTIGRLIAAILFVGCYLGVKLTLGKKEIYEKVIAEFEAYDKDTQKKISKNGLLFFISGIGVFIVSIIVFIIVD